MSNYHILDSSEKLHEIRVAFHIAIPDVANDVGVSYRTALTQYKPSAGSQVPWLEVGNPTEYTAIQAGQVYEHVATVELNANLTTTQKRGLIDAQYNTFKTTILSKIQSILKYWGLNRDVT